MCYVYVLSFPHQIILLWYKHAQVICKTLILEYWLFSMAASIWSNNLYLYFLLNANFFILICFCRASGLAFLVLLNFLFIQGYYISTQVWNNFNWVEIFHIIAFFFQLGIPSWNFNPGWKSTYNQSLSHYSDLLLAHVYY